MRRLDGNQRCQRANHRRIHALANAGKPHVLERCEYANDGAQRSYGIAKR